MTSTIFSTLKSLALSAVLLFGLTAATGPVHPQYTPRIVAAAQAQEYVCEVLEEDCSKIDTLAIEYAHLRQLLGWAGYYWPMFGGEGHIFLDIGFKGHLDHPLAFSVLVHETTHYLVDVLDYGLQPCESEDIAFHISNLWLIEHGHYQYVRWNWRDYYRDC